MYQLVAAIFSILLASQAAADACPSFYRFVEFGVSEPGGARKLGITFRGFIVEGTPLLIAEKTICHTVEKMGKDGRARDIPVVSNIEVDPKVAQLDVTELRLRTVADTVKLTEENATPHRETLAKTSTVSTQGETFVCASMANSYAISCQIASPYENNIALVVYCDADHCQMPEMAHNEHLTTSASWLRTATSPMAVGREISEYIERIYKFLEGQI